MPSQYLRPITILECDSYANLLLAEANGDVEHTAMVFIIEGTRFGLYRWDSSPDTGIPRWRRSAGKFTSIAGSTPAHMDSDTGIFSIDQSASSMAGFMSAAQAQQLLPIGNNAPVSSLTIPSSFSTIIAGYLEIAAGMFYEIALGAILEVT